MVGDVKVEDLRRRAMATARTHLLLGNHSPSEELGALAGATLIHMVAAMGPDKARELWAKCGELMNPEEGRRNGKTGTDPAP